MKIFTVGFYRSGNTWTCRMLADLLKAPVIDLGKPYSVATTADSGHKVIKTHARGINDRIRLLGYTLPRPDSRILLILRDPRDIITSYRFWNKSARNIQEAIDLTIAGNLAGFLDHWYYGSRYNAVVSYEAWHTKGSSELARIARELTGQEYDSREVQEVFERQSADAMTKAGVGDTWYLRRGVPGDWVNHYNRTDAILTDCHFGKFMDDAGYIKSDQWWQSVPKKTPCQCCR